MRNFFDNLRWRMQENAAGRYGTDALSKFLSYAALALIILSLIFRRIPQTPLNIAGQILLYVAFVCIIYSLFRSFSRNTTQRYKELQAFEKIMDKPRKFFNLQRRKQQDRGRYKYFRCSCGQTLRVPVGRGKIEITCPKCRKTMIRNT